MFTGLITRTKPLTSVWITQPTTTKSPHQGEPKAPLLIYNSHISILRPRLFGSQIISVPWVTETFTKLINRDNRFLFSFQIKPIFQNLNIPSKNGKNCMWGNSMLFQLCFVIECIDPLILNIVS